MYRENIMTCVDEKRIFQQGIAHLRGNRVPTRHARVSIEDGHEIPVIHQRNGATPTDIFRDNKVRTQPKKELNFTARAIRGLVWIERYGILAGIWNGHKTNPRGSTAILIG